MIIKDLDILKKYIKEFKILNFEQIASNFRLKIEVSFKNGSMLYIKEIVINGKIRKYSYHWQDEKNKLICRWDNAPDWKNISTFPHHKHYKKEILPSFSINSESIFQEIRSILNNNDVNYLDI